MSKRRDLAGTPRSLEVCGVVSVECIAVGEDVDGTRLRARQSCRHGDGEGVIGLIIVTSDSPSILPPRAEVLEYASTYFCRSHVYFSALQSQCACQCPSGSLTGSPMLSSSLLFNTSLPC
jgi:hypothetical protein